MGGKTTSMNNQYLGFAQASFHSTKWHNGLNSRKVSSISPDGITEIANKLDSLTRDIKNLKENMHAIQVRCETCGGAHLDKECPLHEDVKYHVGPPGYYTRVDNRPPFDENRPNLKELMNKHLEESTWRRADMEDRLKKLQESTNMNIRNQNASLKNLETQVKQLTKDYQAKVANEIPNSSIGQCKVIFTDNEAPRDETSSNGTNELHGVSFISDDNVMVSKKTNEGQSGVLSCQLPLKELSLESFTLPCTIDSLNLYAMTDLGASIMSKKELIRTVENVLVKIDKFVFLTDFVSIDMSGDPNETMILGEDKIMFDINRNIYHHTIHVEMVYMANYVQEEESLYPLELTQVDQGSQSKMIQVKEMMLDNDLKNSKSKDKGSRSRSQSMNEQSHYKQDKTITRPSINFKRHIFNVIGGSEESEERDLNIGGDCSKPKNEVQVWLYHWMNNVAIAPDCASLATKRTEKIFFGISYLDRQKAEPVDRMRHIKGGPEIQENVVISNLTQIRFHRILFYFLSSFVHTYRITDIGLLSVALVESATLGRYGVSVPALHKRQRRKQNQYAQHLKGAFGVIPPPQRCVWVDIHTTGCVGFIEAATGAFGLVKPPKKGAFVVGQPPPEEGASGCGLAQKGGVRLGVAATALRGVCWLWVSPQWGPFGL
ncbi:hypothetical protein Tco_0271006 [Tanacetum coccineum]